MKRLSLSDGGKFCRVLQGVAACCSVLSDQDQEIWVGVKG